jgi:predicted esterase
MATLLIVLHGSGGSGPELRMAFEALPLQHFHGRTFQQAAQMNQRYNHGIEILTPTAPSRPYTPCLGEELNVWFDRSENFDVEGLASKEDSRGVDESLKRLRTLIEENKDKYEHIFVGGFSMGGGLILHLLRHQLPPNVRGLFTMGSFVVTNSAVLTQPLYTHHASMDTSSSSGATIPLLMMHGGSDDLIDVEWGRRTAINLTVRGVDVQFKEYQDVYHDMGEDMVSCRRKL